MVTKKKATTKKVTKTKTKKTKPVKSKIGVEDLMDEIQSKFAIIDDKLDAVIARLSEISHKVSVEHDADFKTRATDTKKYTIPQDKYPKDRKVYKVVCEQCKQECEVPFMPRAGRPVYCKPCFISRRNRTSANSFPDTDKIVAEISRALNVDITKTATPKVKPKRSTVKARPKKTKSKIKPRKSTRK
ncbi:MAG: CxxC-x17-CxxC domain-containing protein [Candidatus Omnitrophota bacterium]